VGAVPFEILLKQQPVATDPRPAPRTEAASPSEMAGAALKACGARSASREGDGSWAAPGLRRSLSPWTRLSLPSLPSPPALGSLAHAVLGCCQLRARRRCCLLPGQQTGRVGSHGWTTHRRGSSAEPSKHHAIFLFLGGWH